MRKPPLKVLDVRFEVVEEFEDRPGGGSETVFAGVTVEVDI